ncbi:MAG TPA: S41 family peptidase [Phycisphaerae bacterium]|nr:S41 family peptidase [Phycisphaerae bacterium]
MEVVVTGCEREVADRMARGGDDHADRQFANALDQTLATLVTKVYPQPKAEVLAANAVAAVCNEFERISERSVTADQKQSWIGLAHTSGSFEPMLKELEDSSAKPMSRRSLIDAGLMGMLESAGWLLSRDQVAELTSIVEARETGTEPGVLGLNLGGWPAVKPIPDSPAAKAGLLDGDTVLMVNDRNVSDITSGNDAAKLLAGSAGEQVKLTVRRQDRTFTYQVKRGPKAVWMVGQTQVAAGVVHIKIPSFEGSGVADKVRQILRQCASERMSAVILDLRNNPGGRPEEANGIADALLDDKRLQIFEFRGGRRVAFQSNAGALSLTVFVLTNSITGSGAEMLAMNLRDNKRATIVGERTAGALFGKDIQHLDDGRAVLFRTEPTILSPTGQDYSTAGVPPDVMVEDAKSSGRDLVLERAIKLARTSTETGDTKQLKESPGESP